LSHPTSTLIIFIQSQKEDGGGAISSNGTRRETEDLKDVKSLEPIYKLRCWLETKVLVQGLLCYGVNSYVEALTPTMAIFGIGASKEVIKVNEGIRVGPGYSRISVLLRPSLSLSLSLFLSLSLSLSLPLSLYLSVPLPHTHTHNTHTHTHACAHPEEKSCECNQDYKREKLLV
jgi:hypothetical protein